MELTSFSLIESDVDVSLYAKPEIDRYQMEEIHLSLKYGLDVSITLCHPEFDWLQMRQVRLGLESGLDVLIYTKPEIHEKNAST